ncbi:UNVERIFIED_CONTAM: Pentatricopeptide repeat-containing protein, chloroplastic [Sesamum radiatum]|uniref:Pentatricopeptide repeat-containing protein, chloroplastic n=1 Tax=Sesamum radiatum TaxID=300843 RepID=A0AAW2RYM3_SESRA
MALNLHSQCSIFSSSFSSLSSPHFQTPHLFTIPKRPLKNLRKAFPIASTSTPHSSPIFLPFLQTPARKQTQEPESENDVENIDDPLLKFFKTRTSDPDPSQEGRISLRKNRRTAWHLASSFESPDSESESETENYHMPVSRNEETSSQVEGVVGEILGIARALQENVTIGEALEGHDFRGRLREEECVEVLRVLAEEGDVMGCLYFFEWMGLREPCLVSPKACSVLFPVLGRAGRGEELLVVFKNLPFEQNKLFRDVRVYNSAITGLLFCGERFPRIHIVILRDRYAFIEGVISFMFDDAWKVYELMETSNIQPDHVTSSIMITIMRMRGDSAKEAWEFFEKMNKKGVKWSLEAVGALIKSFCDEGLKKEALIIQSELEKRGISSNAVIYNTIMDAYSKSNQVEEAEGLFAEMKVKGIAPTAATYNTLMDAYSRRMQPEIVEKLLEEMEGAGLEPNVRSYTCLISAYGRQKKMSDMAANAFLRMKKVGIKPSSHSYTALIHAYSLDGWHEKAYIAFENMLREGIKPSIETYTALLDAFRRAGDTETLMKIWKKMMRDKVKGTHVTFNILLDGFAKQGQYIEARDVICEFGKLGFPPTALTYNMLMNAYARGGQESKLPQLLKEMATLNLKPDSVTYSTMIYAYLRVRDFKRAFFYHKQMVKSGQVPDAKSYQKMRAILDVKAKIKNRKDKSALMGIIESSMGLMKQKKKGKKDEFWKNRKKRSRIPDRSSVAATFGLSSLGLRSEPGTEEFFCIMNREKRMTSSKGFLMEEQRELLQIMSQMLRWWWRKRHLGELLDTDEPYELVGSAVSDPLDEHKKAVVIITMEHFSTDDVESAASDLRELGSNEYHPYSITRLVSMAMDRHDKEKEMASVLLSATYSAVVNAAQISQGFFMLLQSADDLAMDILDAVNVLALFIARAVADDILPPSFITRARKMLSEASKGCGVLQTAEKSCLSAPRHAQLVERRLVEVHILLLMRPRKRLLTC